MKSMTPQEELDHCIHLLSELLKNSKIALNWIESLPMEIRSNQGEVANNLKIAIKNVIEY